MNEPRHLSTFTEITLYRENVLGQKYFNKNQHGKGYYILKLGD